MHELRTRQRLGAGHQASRLPGGSGVYSQIWKNWVTSFRTLRIETIISWVAIFGLSLGLFLAGDWGSRLWIFVILCLLIGQRGTDGLRADLSVWALTRQLPFSSSELLASELGPPVLLTYSLTLIALVISSWIGKVNYSPIFLLAPISVLLIVSASTYDIFRNSRSSELLLGRVAEPGLVGLVLGIFLGALPLGIATWVSMLFKIPGIEWVAGIIGFILGVGIFYLMWRVITTAYLGIN
jgi:hypothetical protein